MRLCGINSRFQLVSPGTGQVSHALLTRPPLTPTNVRINTSVDKSPFDLHVLSTPPAFILSQDQTLEKNLIGSENLADFLPLALLFLKVSSLK